MEIPEISGPPVYDNAYVWLLMKGDSYLPGIYTSVYSVLRTNPEADLVVMVTPDVSERAREMILKVATHLFYIPYLSFNTLPMRTERQRKIYSKWINSSYTKWNMLALPYKKALFVDADTIHTHNTDEIFDIKAPAAPFASPFVKPLGLIKSFYKGPKAPDGYPAHKSIIDKKTMMDTLNKGGVVITANMVLLEPLLSDYKLYIETITKMSEKQPFGFKNSNSAPDEQSICYFYTIIKKKNWTCLHQQYNYIAWKDGFIKNKVPKNIHYISEIKPWVMKYNEYDDIISWYKMAAIAIDKTNIKPADILLKDDDVNKARVADDKFVKKFIKVNTILDIVNEQI
jgi:lipopolysaccharide biosynthesis glycosyltransferase